MGFKLTSLSDVCISLSPWPPYVDDVLSIIECDVDFLVVGAVSKPTVIQRTRYL